MVLGGPIRVVDINREIRVGPLGVQRRMQCNFCVGDVFDLANNFFATLCVFFTELRYQRFGALRIHGFELRARVIRHRVSHHGHRRKDGQQHDEQEFRTEAHRFALGKTTNGRAAFLRGRFSVPSARFRECVSRAIFARWIFVSMVKRKAYPEGLLPQKDCCGLLALIAIRSPPSPSQTRKRIASRNAEGTFVCGEHGNLNEMIPRRQALDGAPGAKPAPPAAGRKLFAGLHVHVRGRVSHTKKKRIFRSVPMKPMSHGRKGLLWVGVAAALWLMAAPQKAPAESADEVPAGPTKLLRYADISRDRVVFVYGGDLWIAPREGGAASRLTSHVGDELYPKFSPDGKWIAFTGEYDGNPDVYLISSEGGEPKRLTFHPSNDIVLGWTPDGKNI